MPRTLTQHTLDKTEPAAYRFVKVDGVMVKVEVRSADAAFEAAMRIRDSRRKEVEKELLIHGFAE